MQPDDADYRVWLRRSQSNLILARTNVEGVEFEDLCFEAQQCAEKAIKAVLISRGATFPFTHDIAHLLTLANAAGAVVPVETQRAGFLSRFATAARYPSIEPPLTREEYVDAVRAAEAGLSWAIAVSANS